LYLERLFAIEALIFAALRAPA